MIMLEWIIYAFMNLTVKQFRVAYSCRLHIPEHIPIYSIAHINLLVNQTKEFISILKILHFISELTSKLNLQLILEKFHYN